MRVISADIGTWASPNRCGPVTTHAPDSTWLHPRKVIEADFVGTPAEELALLVGGNAALLYELCAIPSSSVAR